MSHSCYNGKSKFIFITGGVLSGLGKGVAAASIGALLSRFRVVPVKCDGYLNVDPGTMNPIEHGEVFVLDDGGEVDMDFGHYERFLNISGKTEWSLTMGKVFSTLRERERQGVYAGTTIQFIPHVTDVIKNSFFNIANKENADILLVEIGGTVGDLENEFYLEAARQLFQIVGPENCIFAHLTYVPIPSSTMEQKSKPTQMSVRGLNEKGVYPDIIMGRCREPLSQKIKEKIALYGNIPSKNVISCVDVKSVYEIPLNFQEEGMLDIILKKLKITSPGSPAMDEWKRLVDVSKRNHDAPRKTLCVALCGSHTQLEDSYASIREAMNHAAAHLNVALNLKMIDTSLECTKELLLGANAVIVPGGSSGKYMEGEISLIQIAREMEIPFLGICHGMQLAVIEFARSKCAVPVEDAIVLNGTLRKGGHDVVLKKGSLAEKCYDGSSLIRERFRNCHEVNPKYASKMEENGMVFSGHCAEEGNMAQIMEIPGHPFFLGCQFQPELTSTLLKPSKLFCRLLKAGEDMFDKR
jgi:CTP synthase